MPREARLGDRSPRERASSPILRSSGTPRTGVSFAASVEAPTVPGPTSVLADDEHVGDPVELRAADAGVQRFGRLVHLGAHAVGEAFGDRFRA